MSAIRTLASIESPLFSKGSMSATAWASWNPFGRLTASRDLRSISSYIKACRQSADPREAVADVLKVMRNVGVTRGITTPDKPSIS
jgi:hypothetical protein